jgi:hypothetical protein
MLTAKDVRWLAATAKRLRRLAERYSGPTREWLFDAALGLQVTAESPESFRVRSTRRAKAKKRRKP